MRKCTWLPDCLLSPRKYQFTIATEMRRDAKRFSQGLTRQGLQFREFSAEACTQCSDKRFTRVKKASKKCCHLLPSFRSTLLSPASVHDPNGKTKNIRRNNHQIQRTNGPPSAAWVLMIRQGTYLYLCGVRIFLSFHQILCLVFSECITLGQ